MTNSGRCACLAVLGLAVSFPLLAHSAAYPEKPVRWVVPSVAGPPRRYYRITPAGRETLARWLSIWTTTRAFVDAVATPAAASTSTSDTP